MQYALLKQVSRFISLSLNTGESTKQYGSKIPVWEYSNSSTPGLHETIRSPPRVADQYALLTGGIHHLAPREPLHRGLNYLKRALTGVWRQITWFASVITGGPWASTCLSKAPREITLLFILEHLYQMQWTYQIKVRVAMLAKQTLPGGVMCV